MQIQASFHTTVNDIEADDWNGLDGAAQPFLRHEFLATLEETAAVGPKTAWQPHHIILRSDGRLLAAAPLYIKFDSYGEFIFDWGWADALMRAGRAYYPKMVSAVPFTPVSGHRMLLHPAASPTVSQKLLRSAVDEAKRLNLSSLHWLYINEDEQSWMRQEGLLPRFSHHFLWRNRGYGSFSDYLADLTASRRKKIRRERRRMHESQINFDWQYVADLSTSDHEQMYELYAHTYLERGMLPYLPKAFFAAIARKMPNNVLVLFARQHHDIVGMAIFFRDDTTLYGRYWGSQTWIHSLHFETCYYQGIEYCVKHQLEAFHPGVQGEHKLLRGFSPARDYSAHWFRDEDMHSAVAHALQRESTAIDAYLEGAQEFLPFRKTVDS